MESTSFVTLSLELRLKIYDHALEAGKTDHLLKGSSRYKDGNIPVVPDKKMSISLLLTSKRISLEASQRYWSTATYRVYTQSYQPTDESSTNPCAQMKHLQAILSPFSKLPIQHFELRLLFAWTIPTPFYQDDSPLVSKKDRLLLYDALVSMLSQISTIQSLKLVIPCLCNRTYG
ncbi:MAG: hypothetical protein LQ346_008811 [Caloplaca aetnensis]|nr:MAG: hypothetical protein LQ346_008811 [Caloplaca aetnensis]